MSTPLAASVVDAAALADELARARVVATDRLTELLAEFPGGDPATLAEFLISRGALTAFQADRALAGATGKLILGPYVLKAPHGTGTLGPVYRATHRTRPGVFAIKVFPLRSLWQAKQARQFTRTLATLPQHSGLVPLVDADSANGCHFLVWPLTEGVSLADRVAAGGPLPPAEVAQILGQLADALTACHTRRICHGLVTPWAVCLTSNGARLLDLGSGHILVQNLGADSLLDTITVAGSVAAALDYAAPEWITDPTRLTPAADQYALGAVAHFALTGRPPYAGHRIDDRLLARADRTPRMRDHQPAVPVELATVIDRTLHPDPAERYGGLDMLRELLPEIAARIDPTRPVLLAPGGKPLSEVVSQDEVAPGGERTSLSGSISWGVSGSAILRPVERDDSDASIQFDLPSEPTSQDALPVQAVETPRPGETRPQPSSASRRLLTAAVHAPPEAEPLPAPPIPEPVAAAAHAAHPPLPVLPPLPPSPEPQSQLPTPVQWHTAQPGESADRSGIHPSPPERDPPQSESVLWKRVKRSLLFWQSPTDRVQVSVFGPPEMTPGQTGRLTVFLHTPSSAESVRTLCRALHHDAELLGTAHLAREVARESELAVHLAITNAGVSRTLVTCNWRGQPQRLVFDLHVPWESPGGQAPGVVSVGQDNVRIGKTWFALHILPRKS